MIIKISFNNGDDSNYVEVKEKMIIKVWIVLSIVAFIVQFLIGMRGANLLTGSILPFIFGIFGIYAWWDLSKIGIDEMTKLAFMIPAVMLISEYELLYWHRCFIRMEDKK